jgi:hypothetical protein
MLISGRCHCGNISFALDWRPEPSEIPARACTCSFCAKHGGVWTSCATGSLTVGVKDRGRLSKYAFGTKTAEFYVCTACGVVPVVTSGIDGRLYAVGRRWSRGAQILRFELLAMGAVVDPLARGHDPFPGGNDSRMAHHRYDVTMAACPRAQNAEAVLSVVVGDSLDESGQNFPSVRLRTHADHCIPISKNSPATSV